jgi:hypothetical protein
MLMPVSRAAAASAGWEYDLEATQDAPPPGPLVDPTVTEKHPFVVRIRVPWGRIESQQGIYDWAQLDGVVDRFHGAAHRVILTIFGPNDVYAPGGVLPTSSRDALRKGWLDMLRDAAQHFRGRVQPPARLDRQRRRRVRLRPEAQLGDGALRRPRGPGCAGGARCPR